MTHGRRLYTIEFDAVFSAQMTDCPDTWHALLDELRSTFEQGCTADLVIPVIGTIGGDDE